MPEWSDITVEQYDLIIIGSGPGGYRAAIEAARRRARATIIEQAGRHVRQLGLHTHPIHD